MPHLGSACLEMPHWIQHCLTPGQAKLPRSCSPFRSRTPPAQTSSRVVQGSQIRYVFTINQLLPSRPSPADMLHLLPSAPSRKGPRSQKIQRLQGLDGLCTKCTSWADLVARHTPLQIVDHVYRPYALADHACTQTDQLHLCPPPTRNAIRITNAKMCEQCTTRQPEIVL
jgi:hypothetical protein